MNNFLRRVALAVGAVILLAAAFSLSRVGSDLVTMQSELAWIRPERDQVRQLYFVTVDAEIAKLRYTVSHDETSAREFSRALGAAKQESEDAVHVNNKHDASPFISDAAKRLQAEVVMGRVMLTGGRSEAAAAASKSFDNSAVKLRSDFRSYIDDMHRRGDALNASMARQAREFIYGLIFGIIGLVIAYFTTKPRPGGETIAYIVADHSRSLDLERPRN